MASVVVVVGVGGVLKVTCFAVAFSGESQQLDILWKFGEAAGGELCCSLFLVPVPVPVPFLFLVPSC